MENLAFGLRRIFFCFDVFLLAWYDDENNSEVNIDAFVVEELVVVIVIAVLVEYFG
jgi:hypothetical protein